MSIDLALLVPQSGQKTRILCPECNGGSTQEKSLVVSNEAGRISWYCFRDSCGNRGSDFTGMAEGMIPPRPQEAELRPFDGAAFPLPEDKWRYLQTAYNVDGRKAGIRYTLADRYLLPINSYYGDSIGWIARVPWGQTRPGEAKSLTYWHERAPLLAWNARPKYHGERASVVLAVEDQLSAIRAHQVLEATTVALLGTGVNQEKIGAIQAHTDNLVIALDKDATGQAFNIARKWGQAFKSCRVLILEHDIKDMHLSDLHELVI